MTTGFAKLRQYSRSELETRSTSELEWHYMDAYKHAFGIKNPDTDARLSTITHILSSRKDKREKRTIHAQINSRLTEALKQRNLDDSVMYRNMLYHYESYVWSKK